jgi:hypothetical protein
MFFPHLGVILISTGLIYVLGARLFSSKTYGAIVAACFATTPLVMLAARGGSASLYQLPFVIGWLLCVDRFRTSGATRDLAGAGAVLGLGVYSFWAAAVMMPVYLAITVLALVMANDLRLGDRRIGAMAAAFVIAAAPMAVYVLVHPEYFRDRILAYGLYDANRYNILQGAREVFSWVGLTARSEVYYDYFNPAFLFLSGGGLARSLARPQVFHLPYALLLAAGLHRIVTRDVPLTAPLAIAAFLAAPAAAALTAQPPLAARAILMAPAAAVIAAYGVVHLLEFGRLRVAAKNRG